MKLLERIANVGAGCQVPLGYEEANVSLVLIITSDGEFVSLERVKGRREVVPVVGRTGKQIRSNFIFETFVYTFGAGRIVKGCEWDMNCHRAFLTRLEEMEHPAAQATLKFLRSPSRPLILPLGAELARNQIQSVLDDTPRDGDVATGSPKLIKQQVLTDNMKARRAYLPVIECAMQSHPSYPDLDDVPWIAVDAAPGFPVLIEVQEAGAWWLESPLKEAVQHEVLSGREVREGQCGITGAEGKIVRLVRFGGGQSLVSFNFGSVDSYGNTQAFNAPTSPEAAHNLSLGLDYLSRFNSTHVWYDIANHKDADRFFFWGRDRDAEVPSLIRRLVMGTKDTGEGPKGMLTADELGVLDGPGYTMMALGINMARWVVGRWFDLDGQQLRERLQAWVETAIFTYRKDDIEHTRMVGVRELVMAYTTVTSRQNSLIRDILYYLFGEEPFPHEMFKVAFGHIQTDGLRRGAFSGRFLSQLAFKEIGMTDNNFGCFDPFALGAWFEEVCAWYHVRTQARRSLESKLFDLWLDNPYKAFVETARVAVRLERIPGIFESSKRTEDWLEALAKKDRTWSLLARKLREAGSNPRGKNIPERFDAESKCRFALGYDFRRNKRFEDARKRKAKAAEEAEKAEAAAKAKKADETAFGAEQSAEKVG